MPVPLTQMIGRSCWRSWRATAGVRSTPRAVEGVDSYRHRAVPVAAAAVTFESLLYFVFRKHPIDRVFAKPFPCRITVLALGVVDVERRESVLSHELV